MEKVRWEIMRLINATNLIKTIQTKDKLCNSDIIKIIYAEPVIDIINEDAERAIRYAVTSLFVRCQNMPSEKRKERQYIWNYIRTLAALVGENIDAEVPEPTPTDSDVGLPYYVSKIGGTWG